MVARQQSNVRSSLASAGSVGGLDAVAQYQQVSL
jgi:hypothetical protein